MGGCQQDFLESNTKPRILPHKMSFLQDDIVSVYSQDTPAIPSLFVQHEIKGNQVLVECIVNGISFRESDRSQKKVGKLVVWVDGKRKSEVSSAAFIIKGLSPGSHKLKLEMVNLENESYGLAKEFMVNIPR